VRAGGDHAHIIELFASFGPVSVRRMFGGSGIFVDGVMIGLVSDGAIYLKAGPATIPDFEREGLGPFTYPAKGGNRTLTSYWRIPDRLYDDPEELAHWARHAHAVALQGSRQARQRSAPRKAADRVARSRR
jgi:DNA transformation protein